MFSLVVTEAAHDDLDEARGKLLTDNFCIMDDGWHFVCSPCEMAPYAAGVVDVVILR